MGAARDAEAEIWGAGNDIGFALRLAQVAVFKDLIRSLEPSDLRPAQYAALSLVHGRPGLQQHELGLLLNIQKPNLVALVEGLGRRGFVVRKRQGRSYALTLSASGAEVFADIERVAAAHEDRITEILGGSAQRQLLLTALRRLAAAL